MLARLVPFGCLLATLSGCGGTTATGNTTPETVELAPVSAEALRAFQSGVRDMERRGANGSARAREHFAEALRLEPSLWEAHYNLGVLARREGDLRTAATEFEAARAIQPGSSDVLSALAETRDALGDHAAAAALLRAYIEQHPEATSVRISLATVLREQGDAEGALAEAREVLVRDPRNVRALAEIGRVLRQREQYDVAELVLRKAVDIEDRAELHNDLGLIQLARGDTQAAFQEFQRAIALDASFIPAHLNQGAVLLRAGDYAGASGEYRAALRTDRDNADAHVALGAALRGQGEHAQARREYEAALEIAPNHPGALFNMGVLLADFLDQRPAARGFFERFVAVAPAGTHRETAERYLSEIPAPTARAEPAIR